METSLLVKREFMMTEVALAFTTGAFSTEEEWGRAGGGILLSPSSTYSGQKNVREERERVEMTLCQRRGKT